MCIHIYGYKLFIVHFFLTRIFNAFLKKIPSETCITFLCNSDLFLHKSGQRGSGVLTNLNFFNFHPILMQFFATDHLYELLMAHYFILLFLGPKLKKK